MWPSVGCHQEKAHVDSTALGNVSSEGKIYWPPRDPERVRANSSKPLLDVVLSVDAQQDSGDRMPVRLKVILRRPSTEADRAHWNSTLAFEHVDWMHEVRVWDKDDQWLWPNLSYLLRLPGEERVDRYGGVDPGKHVDNDFAAVLIRKYDAAGAIESDDTISDPLVSAKWHPVDQSNADRHTVSHAARSDEFLLHLGNQVESQQGKIKVWLIYADFFGARAPHTWPDESEWAGGILAYFEVDWEASLDDGPRFLINHKAPPESTRFNWQYWAGQVRANGEATTAFRLSDVSN